jgi:hypothetical protein
MAIQGSGGPGQKRQFNSHLTTENQVRAEISASLMAL